MFIVILKSTESEQAYTVYEELRKEVCIVPSIKHCSKEDCVPCSIVSELLADAEVRKYIDPRNSKFVRC